MKSILILESSESVAKLCADIFDKRGWAVTACEDRDDALERLTSESSYKVILLGYSVPGANGVQLVRFIRGLKHRRMAAVVMVTDRVEIIEEALSAGANEVLLDPINPGVMVSLVDRHFS
ncbi:MAG: response regulator [Blastocatellia bacterium]